jgi:hypothetical protein
MEWLRLPWKSRDNRKDWKAVQARAGWREICHPMTGKVVLKYNLETGEVAIKDGGWVYVTVVPEFRARGRG